MFPNLKNLISIFFILKFFISFLVISGILYAYFILIERKINILQVIKLHAIPFSIYVLAFFIEGLFNEFYGIPPSFFSLHYFLRSFKNDYLIVFESIVIWDIFYVIILTISFKKFLKIPFLKLFLNFFLLNLFLVLLWVLLQLIVLIIYK